ncbi:MAG: DUF1579 family protein [Bacteroidota bacterium]
MKILFVASLTIMAISTGYSQNPDYPCQSQSGDFLTQLVGNWTVETKDRTSPGQYETNKGHAIIAATIAGCGIQETYKGSYKGNQYARFASINTKSDNEMEMTATDSEHAGSMHFKGELSNGQISLLWYRDESIKKMQSKYVLEIKNDREFEFSSFLSTDYGKTWALTHERKYTKAGHQTATSSKDDKSSIQGLLDAYYDCISGPIRQPRQLDRLRSLFHPEGRLIYSYWTPGHEKAEVLVMNLEEFIEKIDYADKKGFFEHEIANTVHTFGAVTQVFSTYEFRSEDKTIAGRGITSYELLFDGSRYWIMSMFWTAEDDQYKIPEQYLRN